ncbi:MAG: hypothetical protein HGA36_05245 [Candidatus Moranbacteria bacterium]|nr:hypothetical protein [Candidatus Moranbacteria bacterium]
MINKKIITPAGLDLLWKIMQTCPATPLNGGEHAKKHLQILCENGENVLGCELRKGIVPESSCACEGEMDVYTHLLENTKSDTIDRLEIMEYFGGDIHAKKIFADTKKDGLPGWYALKVVYGHLLVPIIVDDPENLVVVDSEGVIIRSLFLLENDKTVYVQGDAALMHYGFIIGKTTAGEMDVLNAINQKSQIFLQAVNSIQEKMDFATMHYYPRSRKMAGK